MSFGFIARDVNATSRTANSSTSSSNIPPNITMEQPERSSTPIFDVRMFRFICTAMLLTTTFGNVLICWTNFSSQCSTVSCATDHNELSDRLSTQLHTIHTMAVVCALYLANVPISLCLLDGTAFLLFSLTSSDVVGDNIHAAITFVHITIHMSLLVFIVWQRPTYTNILIFAFMRALGFALLIGYSCPEAIPDVCASLASPKLPPFLVMLIELSICATAVTLLCAAIIRTAEDVESDIYLVATFLYSAASTLVLLFPKFSAGSLLIVTGFVGVDMLLGFRLYKLPRFEAKCHSLFCLVPIIPSSVYAFL